MKKNLYLKLSFLFLLISFTCFANEPKLSFSIKVCEDPDSQNQPLMCYPHAEGFPKGKPLKLTITNVLNETLSIMEVFLDEQNELIVKNPKLCFMSDQATTYEKLVFIFGDNFFKGEWIGYELKTLDNQIHTSSKIILNP